MQSGQIDEMRLRKLWYSVVAQIQTANILYKISYQNKRNTKGLTYIELLIFMKIQRCDCWSKSESQIMTAVRTLNSPPDSNVKPSEILKVANSFWERVQPEKMANAAHLDFPIIFKVITIDSHHGILTWLLTTSDMYRWTRAPHFAWCSPILSWHRIMFSNCVC